MASRAAAPEALVESYRRLAEVFHDVLSEQSLDALLDRIARTLADLVPYDSLIVYQADEARRLLTPVLARDPWAEKIMQTHARFGSGITGWAVENREPVLTNRANLDPRVVVVPGTPPDEPEALVCVPLISRGAVKGALNIYRLGEEARFLDHEFELAQWFGDAAALALDNAQVRERLEREAQTDSLTGLYNHRAFHERLRAELQRANRVHDTVALLMFDIDDFKRVNDLYGHGVGDQLLIWLARLAREAVRGSDVVCRLGGEEFAVIMTSCDAGDAIGLARRLTDELARREFAPAGHVTVSVGIAQGPEHAMNPRELIACAEAAMMTAKAQGKNRVVLFDEGGSERPGAPAAGRDVRSIAHLKMLQSLAGKLARLNEVGQIGEAIASELRMLIDYHSCRVFVREGDDLIPVSYLGDMTVKGGHLDEALATKVGVGVTGRVAATGESMLVPDALDCEFSSIIPGTDAVDESLLAVPLRYGARVIGVIIVSKLGLDQFEEDDLRLLEVLAGHASVALENARLYEAQRREAESAKALLLLADALGNAEGVTAIARESVAAAARLVAGSEAALWLRDDDGSYDCVATFPDEGRVEPRLRSGEALSLLLGRYEPFVSDDGWMVAPLYEGEGVAGWVAVRDAERDEREPVSDERLRLLASVSYQASMALQKARLYDTQAQSAEIASSLLEFSRELATAEGIDDVLRRIVELSVRILGSERASVWLQEPKGLALRLQSSFGYAPEVLAQMRRSAYPRELTEQWLVDGEPFMLRPGDLAGVEGVPEYLTRTSFAVASFRIEGGRVGCLVATVGDEFDERRMRLLSGLAHQAKLAIEGATTIQSLEETFVSTVEALANALEANDEYTSSHARWITDMAVMVGRELGLDGVALKRLELGALFHDIGKIGIPSEILQKPGPLTPEERIVIEGHPQLGERILAPIDRLAEVRPVVRACHERWDGHGYPDGKAGDQIPLESRIILVCDAFHAMTTDRPYRGRLSREEACRRLREASASQFDPAVVETFMRLVDEQRLAPLD
ncbi:MAG TPA: diguanylate cyclase [Gaiellaceae bacterium]|nr:diguanylate cyclase [Gaiellaceae bacterium]